jgi:hypothetical protein
MDRISRLADDLTAVLDQLHEEAAEQGARSLMAPLAWLDEANSWLQYELRALREQERRERIPFTYIPLALPK